MGTFVWSRLIQNYVSGSWNVADKQAVINLNIDDDVLAHMNTTGRLDVCIRDDTGVDYMILRVWSCPILNEKWPPEVGSFWVNGEPIEYPEGTSWDMAFVLTTNRKYSQRRGYWRPQPPISEAGEIYPTPYSRVDFNDDLIINLKDFAVLADYWLTEGFLWP